MNQQAQILFDIIMSQSLNQAPGQRKFYTTNKSKSRYTSFQFSTQIPVHQTKRNQLAYLKKFKMKTSFLIHNQNPSKKEQYQTLKQKYQEAVKKFTVRPHYRRTHKTISNQSRQIKKSTGPVSNISELSIRKQPLRMHTEQVSRPLKIKVNNLLLNQIILPHQSEQNSTNKHLHQNPKFNLTEIEDFEPVKIIAQEEPRPSKLQDRNDQKKGLSRKIRNIWREHKKELFLSVNCKDLGKQEDKLKGWQIKNTHRQQLQHYQMFD